jgi:hypothetical protein
MNIHILKREIIILLILLSLLFLCLPHVTGLNITNKTGESYIEWSWDSIESSTVYIDGNLFHSNWTFGNTIITNLNPDEMHRIDIIIGENSYNQTTYTSKNFYQTTYFYVLSITIILLIVSLGISLISFGAWVFAFLLLFETLTQYQNDINFIYYFILAVILFIASGLKSWANYKG